MRRVRRNVADPTNVEEISVSRFEVSSSVMELTRAHEASEQAVWATPIARP